MFKVSIGNRVTLFKQATLLVLTLGIYMHCDTVQAGAFKDLAMANNAVYRELRDLGTARMSDKLAVQSKNFNPALRALSREHGQTYLSWKKAIKANSTETREEIAELLGHNPITGKNEDGSSGEGTAKAGVPVAAPKGRAAETAAEQGGSDGAKGVGYGGKRVEKKPAVDDSGIIMER